MTQACPRADPASSIKICATSGESRYVAELLESIGSVSLTIAFGDRVPVNLISNGDRLTFASEDGITQDIVLPAAPLRESVARIHVAPNLSVRIGTVSGPQKPTARSALSFQTDSPWSAADLGRVGTVQFRCRECSKVILQSPKQWKALPSEYWVELMEFWHCHKPAENLDTDTNPSYFDGKIHPRLGLIYVSNAYFLAVADDLTLCEHIQADGIDGQVRKLWKWDLKLVGVPGIEHVEPTTFFAALLKELMDSHAVYTYQLPRSDGSPLLLWVFNPDVRISITGHSQPFRAMKVLYSSDPKKTMDLAKTRADIEDVEIPPRAGDLLLSALEKSTASLPAQAQKFGDWLVAYLDL